MCIRDSYVLISTRDADNEEIRSYRIVDGTVTEEQITIDDH